MPLPGEYSILETEAIAVQKGALLAKEMELQQVIFESNALSVVNSVNADMIEKIMESITPQERTSVFIKRSDKQGSTPLQYAAYFNCSSTTNRLLEVDRSIAYMKDAKGMTALRIAAHQAGDTMPGGFMGHDAGPHLGSPILIRNTGFKAFIITNTIAMVQYYSAAFIYLYMPLLFHDNNPGRFTFLLASLAFCLSISAMGAMLLASVTDTFAVLMHSLGLAISNCVIIGLLFFIPALFIIIECSHHYNVLIWSMSCISWDI
ncbi:hypothetical protein SO802_022080 [Lithocarpus litseifolius]|uniref:PGG domain-containing protein n=1 Tax=Lithocarpus litseifolius TaxID=425828 RepID=A0AAW2CJL5_9ROSI